MAKQQNWLVIGAIVLVGAVYLGYITIPSGAVGGGNTGGGGTAPVGSTQNASFETSLLDSATQAVKNQGIIRVLDNGVLVRTGTSAAGTLQLANLESSKNYTIEVVNEGDTTYFYPFSKTATTKNAGPQPIALLYKSTLRTAPTITVYNNDDLTANTFAAPNAIGANDTKKFRIRWSMASAVGTDINQYGDGAAPILFVVDYNTQYIQGIDLKDSGGNLLATSSVPSGHTNIDGNLQTNGSNKAWLLDKSSLTQATDTDYYMYVTTNAFNPQVTGAAIAGFSTCEFRAYIMDTVRYQNRFGQYVEGYLNTDTQAQLGAPDWNVLMYCS